MYIRSFHFPRFCLCVLARARDFTSPATHFVCALVFTISHHKICRYSYIVSRRSMLSKVKCAAWCTLFSLPNTNNTQHRMCLCTILQFINYVNIDFSPSTQFWTILQAFRNKRFYVHSLFSYRWFLAMWIYYLNISSIIISS